MDPSYKDPSHAFPVSTASGDQHARGAAFDVANFLAIWAAEDGLRGRRLSSTGQLLSTELVFTAEEVEEAATVAYGGGQYLVVWVAGSVGAHAAKGRLVSPAGQLGDVLALRRGFGRRERQNPDRHFQINFNGVLQSSTNLQTWTDYTPQPASPWTHQIGEGSLFFRMRADSSPNPVP